MSNRYAGLNGRRTAFKLGPDPRRVIPRGRPKIFQKMKMLTLEMLCQPADDLCCSVLGLTKGSSWNECRIKALILAACGQLDGVDVAAQKLLHDATEGVISQMVTVVNIDESQLDRARSEVMKYLDVKSLEASPRGKSDAKA